MSRVPLRIVLHAVPLASAGGRTVGLNIVRSLGEVGGRHSYLALVPAGVGYEEACTAAGLEYRTYERRPGYAAWRVWFDQVGVQRVAREWRADVLCTLGNLGPIRPSLPHAVLFHNSYYLYPWDGFSHRLTAWEHLLYRGQRLLFRWSLKRAGLVMAQTEVAAERLASQFGLPASRLAIVPNAISLEHLRGNSLPSVASKTMAEHGAAGRFRLLTVSRYYPHKNLELLVEVAAQLRRRCPGRFVFFLTISPDQHPSARRLLQQVERLGLGSEIVNLGPIALEELAGAYEQCDAMILPTCLESSSGTYLEAMHFGRPIITSDRDFAHASCGEAAMYFDPLDERAAATALESLADDADLRARLVAAGRQVLAQGRADWSKVTEALVRNLERTVATQPGPRDVVGIPGSRAP